MGYIPALEEILHEIHVTNLPKPSDYDNRKDLVRVFNEIAKEIYGNFLYITSLNHILPQCIHAMSFSYC
ncbi:unnamed protein product [Ilex paraguariensis]